MTLYSFCYPCECGSGGGGVGECSINSGSDVLLTHYKLRPKSMFCML